MDDDDDLFAGLGDSRPAKNTTTNAKPNNSDFMSSLFGTGDFFKVAEKKMCMFQQFGKTRVKDTFLTFFPHQYQIFFGKCMYVEWQYFLLVFIL